MPPDPPLPMPLTCAPDLQDEFLGEVQDTPHFVKS